MFYKQLANHNFSFALLLWLLIISGPYISSPLYKKTNGALVVHVQEGTFQSISPLSVIVRINDCEINNAKDFVDCLANMYINNCTVLYYCGNNSYPHHSIQHVNCCNSDNEGPQCWKYNNRSTPDVESKFCYSARDLVNNKYCKSNNDCDKDELCYTPVLPNSIMLMKVEKEDKSFAMIASHPYHLFSYVQVGDYVLRFEFLRSIIPPYLPDTIRKFLWYSISISSALAILNSTPVYVLDGEHAFTAFIELFFVNLDKKKKLIITNSVFIFGALLLVTNIIISIGIL